MHELIHFAIPKLIKPEGFGYELVNHNHDE